MLTTLTLTIDQRRAYERIVLGTGDAYEFIAQRLVEAGDLETYEELDRRFSAASNVFEQAAVVQEFQRKLAATTTAAR
jgi:hypothetical protein